MEHEVFSLKRDPSANKSLPVSVVIMARNEERHIEACLDSVAWASDVLVIDSGSTDRTVFLAENKGARVVFQVWLGFGPQRNFAVSKCKYSWIFQLDADERVSQELYEEIRNFLLKTADTGSLKGMQIPRQTYFAQYPVSHCGWYPNYVLRWSHREFSSWTDSQIHEQLLVRGAVGKFSGHILHYSFANVSDQVLKNVKYAEIGARQLEDQSLAGPSTTVRLRAHCRNMLGLTFRPLIKFLSVYIYKRGFLDGFYGWVIAWNSAHSEFMKYALLIEKKRKNND